MMCRFDLEGQEKNGKLMNPGLILVSETEEERRAIDFEVVLEGLTIDSE
jgi:hypothetical protein